ncbi:hypothetical protein OEZ86_012049 [Tetradesmus obliquus]|nr:hypothetical protein OEZ86_012049 [Tetradesmus obliquus]
MEYKNAQVYSMHCLGSSIYSSGHTAPPFCLGVEFLRYSQAMIQQQQQHAATRTAAQHHTLPSTASASSSSSGVAAAYHAAHSSALQQQQQHEVDEQDALLQQDGFLQDSFEEQQQQQDAAQGLLQRVQRRRAEINEKLEGQDPLWFAKAFAHRASLNWASMRRLAGDIAAQAKADLGFERDETE